jgi:hypothetical protein
VLQKCCNQKKPQWKYWTQWTFRHLKNAKIQTKTHEMDVLEAVENETLESHASVREKRPRQATLLLFVQKVEERS